MSITEGEMYSLPSFPLATVLGAFGVLLSACTSIDKDVAPEKDAAQNAPQSQVIREASTGSRLRGGSSANNVRTLRTDDAKDAMRNAPPNPGTKTF
jgi:starvation-inducible outer membrane lipoprotein